MISLFLRMTIERTHIIVEALTTSVHPALLPASLTIAIRAARASSGVVTGSANGSRTSGLYSL
jgi:hypothetical protein